MAIFFCGMKKLRYFGKIKEKYNLIISLQCINQKDKHNI